MTDKSDEFLETSIRPSPTGAQEFVGRSIAHYKILERLGSGGMGVVYKAEDTKLRRLVALKFLPPEWRQDETAKQRFLREAQAASAIDHPNICNVHEINETDDGRLYMVLAYYEGETLRQRIHKNGPIAPEQAIDIVLQAAQGLEKAHAQGIVHRDVKPANLIVTKEGIVKILDFGLVKIAGGLRLTGQATVGTVAYMSPEQTRGGETDARTDIWSLGIVLYEMLTGELPFRGDHPQSIIFSIRNDSPAPLSKTTQRLSSGTPSRATLDELTTTPLLTPELQRIVNKCLTKDPNARYPSMRDLIRDLRALRGELDSGLWARFLTGLRHSRTIWVGALICLVLLLSSVFFLRGPPSSQSPGGDDRSSRSLAVLYFQNNTGDPGLDWLRTALTDLLVTDLAQSPHLEVLATDRLYQILKDTNRLDESITSSDVVQEVADRGNVEDVLLGSFVRAGERIRINVTLQEARSGKILMTERVEGVGESSIFPMVDELNRRIRTMLDVPETADKTLDRGLKDVTTSSLEAYRYYADGIWLHERGRYDQAISFYQKALDIDPGFAMALSKLSRALYAQGRIDSSEEYARRALEQVDRLSGRERYYVEGAYNGIREENYDRAIEAYQQALELYPDHASARFDLARRYLLLERYPEAIEQLHELSRRGSTLPETYGDLSYCYAARGDFQTGYEILQDFLGANPDSSGGYFWLGLHLTRWGKLEEALGAYRKEAAVAPGDAHWVQIGQWFISLLREEWEEVEASARGLESSSDVFFRQSGLFFQAMRELYRGRSEAALATVERALEDHPERGLGTADLRSLAAYIRLEQGRAREALEQAEIARREGRGHRPEWSALVFTSLAQAALGEGNEAEKTAEVFRAKLDGIPSQRIEALYYHLAGELALREGDGPRALEALGRAQALLPPRGFTGPPTESPPAPHIPHHVPIWFSTALAYWAQGDRDEAVHWFQRIAQSTNERINWPLPYVRSFYFLGKYFEERGQRDEARRHYRRFVDFWEDGDLDRERVQEARGGL